MLFCHEFLSRFSLRHLIRDSFGIHPGNSVTCVWQNYSGIWLRINPRISFGFKTKTYFGTFSKITCGILRICLYVSPKNFHGISSKVLPGNSPRTLGKIFPKFCLVFFSKIYSRIILKIQDILMGWTALKTAQIKTRQ